MNIKTNKHVLALAISSVLMAPWAAQAGDDVGVSGFIDVIGNSDAGAVFVADAEIDATKKMGAVTVRVDMDVRLAGNGAGTSTPQDADGNGTVSAAEAAAFSDTDSSLANLEQAYFAWGATENITVLGGLFNNPIGQEAEDAPDMNFTSHSVTYSILDHQTALYGNNVAGIAAACAVGPATLTVAVVDDLGFAATASGKGKLSTAAVVNFSPMKGLDFELGYVTQDVSAENVFDFNGMYTMGALTVGLDYLAADKIVESATNLWVGFDVNNKMNVKARYETVSFDLAGVEDATKTTVYGTYTINNNLSAALEHSIGSNDNAGATGVLVNAVTGVVDDNVTTLEFIGTF